MKPPRAPSAPTTPPAAPTSSGKWSGMYLKTDAFPIPIAQPRANIKKANAFRPGM